MTTGAGAGFVVAGAGAGAAAFVVAGDDGFAVALVGAADGVVLVRAMGDAVAGAAACTALCVTCATGAIAALALGAPVATAPTIAPVTAAHDAAVTAILCLCAAMDSGRDRLSLGTNNLPSAGGHGEATAGKAAVRSASSRALGASPRVTLRARGGSTRRGWRARVRPVS